MVDPLGTIVSIISISKSIHDAIQTCQSDLPKEIETLKRTVTGVEGIVNNASRLVQNNRLDPNSIADALVNVKSSLEKCNNVVTKYQKRSRLLWIFVAGSFAEKVRRTETRLYTDLGILKAALGVHVAVDVQKLLMDLKQFRDDVMARSEHWREMLERAGWAGVGVGLAVVLVGGGLLRRSMSKPPEPTSLEVINGLMQTGAKVMREAPKEARSWIATLQR